LAQAARQHCYRPLPPSGVMSSVVAGWWSRITPATAAEDNSLKGTLQKVTDSGCDVCKMSAEVSSIVQACNAVEDRRIVMRHLGQCFSVSNDNNWRGVYAALCVLGQLLMSGTPELVTEVGDGHHFDVVQRLTSIEEKFEYGLDPRVQMMVRNKAGVARDDMRRLLQENSGEGAVSPAAKRERSKHHHSKRDGSSKRKDGKCKELQSFGSDSLPAGLAEPAPAVGKKLVGGLAVAGFNNDTTDDDSEPDGRQVSRPRAAEESSDMSRRRPGTQSARRRKQLAASSSPTASTVDSEGSSPDGRITPTVAPECGLLDMHFDDHSPAVIVPTRAMAHGDLDDLLGSDGLQTLAATEGNIGSDLLDMGFDCSSTPATRTTSDKIRSRGEAVTQEVLKTDEADDFLAAYGVNVATPDPVRRELSNAVNLLDF